MIDYKKKYLDALERANSFQEKYGGDYAGYIFPELRESEDERIRRTLAEYFGPEVQLDFVRGVPIQKIRDWLEKQKEPHFTKRNALFDKCVENCDPEIMKRVSDEVDEMLEKEQKPAEWSEEDEDMLNSCISSIEEAKENRYAYKETDGDTSYDHEIAWLKLLRNRVGKEFLQPHWKPSEEQMRALLKVVDKARELHYSSNSGYDEYDVLRSLYKQLKEL